MKAKKKAAKKTRREPFVKWQQAIHDRVAKSAATGAEPTPPGLSADMTTVHHHVGADRLRQVLKSWYRQRASIRWALSAIRKLALRFREFELYADKQKFSNDEVLDKLLEEIKRLDPAAQSRIAVLIGALRDRIGEPEMVVFDPISPEERDAPEEQRKKSEYQLQLAHAVEHVAVSCEVHGHSAAKVWSVGVEMRSPIAVRDRFFVVVDADGIRRSDIGPMSADVANHLLAWTESALAANLPGSENGSVSRAISDLSSSLAISLTPRFSPS